MPLCVKVGKAGGVVVYASHPPVWWQSSPDDVSYGAQILKNAVSFSARDAQWSRADTLVVECNQITNSADPTPFKFKAAETALQNLSVRFDVLTTDELSAEALRGYKKVLLLVNGGGMGLQSLQALAAAAKGGTRVVLFGGSDDYGFKSNVNLLIPASFESYWRKCQSSPHFEVTSGGGALVAGMNGTHDYRRAEASSVVFTLDEGGEGLSVGGRDCSGAAVYGRSGNVVAMAQVMVDGTQPEAGFASDLAFYQALLHNALSLL